MLRTRPYVNSAAVFLALCCLCLPIVARSTSTNKATPAPQFKSAVNTQVAAARKIAPELGVHIMEVASGQTVYSFNPDTLRIIASNTKLFTSATALDHLGPGYFFETQVLARGEIQGNTLVGDLAVVGGGDPNLSGRQYNGDPFGPFREWATVLRDLGVERIDGDVFLVHGLFDDVHTHPDWPRDQLTKWYEAPVDALSFSDNCVLVKVKPGRSGQAARVETVPPIDLFTVESTATTTDQRRRQWLGIDRKSGTDVLTVSGRIYKSTRSVDKWVTIDDPPRYFGVSLVTALAEEGIAHSGRIQPVEELRDTGGSAAWRLLVTHRTDLLTVLEVINKRSQNFYSESVIKLLGARNCGAGTWAAGVRVVQEFLASLGIAAGDYKMADGSGMSRNNHFTPSQITRLLRHMFEHRWGREFVKTLPYSGEHDLRWEKRLSQPPYRENVIAKTGYLNGVSSLSGYAKARSGKLYAFSILCNRSRSGSSATAAQDRIVKALIDHG